MTQPWAATAWMSTEQAKRAAYRQRKHLVEPVFGIINEQQHARPAARFTQRRG